MIKIATNLPNLPPYVLPLTLHATLNILAKMAVVIIDISLSCYFLNVPYCILA